MRLTGRRRGERFTLRRETSAADIDKERDFAIERRDDSPVAISRRAGSKLELCTDCASSEEIKATIVIRSTEKTSILLLSP
jgi:hypothetical protein